MICVNKVYKFNLDIKKCQLKGENINEPSMYVIRKNGYTILTFKNEKSRILGKMQVKIILELFILNITILNCKQKHMFLIQEKKLNKFHMEHVNLNSLWLDL